MKPLNLSPSLGDVIHIVAHLSRSVSGWVTVPGSLLQIIDFSFIEGNPPNILTTCTSADSSIYRARLISALQSLPKPNQNSCRIYIEQNSGFEPGFKTDIKRSASTDSSDYHHASSSFVQLLSQCRDQQSKSQWWSCEMYTFYSFTKIPSELFAGLVRSKLRLRFASDADCNMIFIISCGPEMMCVNHSRNGNFMYGYKPGQPPTQNSYVALQALTKRMVDLDKVYKECGKNVTSIEIRRQLVVLRFCHATLLAHSQALDSFQYFYTASIEKLCDPERAKITSSTLQEISRNAELCEQLQQSITSLASTTEALLDMLLLRLPNSTDVRNLNAELRAVCTDVNRTALSLSARLDCHLKFVELGRSLREYSSLWLLSLLACIFLPLSLASSLLSMQTRFVDLHYLLYDFFGVIVLLATLTLLIIGVIRFITWCSERIASLDIGPRFRRLIAVGIWLAIYVPWGLVLASFIVGMAIDVSLGMRILGYGAGTIGAGMGIVAAGVGLVRALWVRVGF
ncbi:hypothetical protein CC80DRAFT_26306 [Byssothecium circinans]|uniref:Uncharacterized protein n=1 Tax=Byssothecium circinans TaxID=147558 RepID=A0A6A5U2M6_9PLEO|nr:hypothetical protein CC80DRAFT_26306 [Byssothecium circinans]